MERLFVMLSALVVAVKMLNEAVGVALEVLVKDLREWCEEVGDRDSHYHGEAIQLRVKCKDLEEQCNFLENNRREYSHELAEARRQLDAIAKGNDWRALPVSFWLRFDNRWLLERKIYCVAALREVFGLGLKDAKEMVEKKFESGEPLFTEPLSASDLNKALNRLIKNGNPVPVDELYVFSAHNATCGDWSAIMKSTRSTNEEEAE